MRRQYGKNSWWPTGNCSPQAEQKPGQLLTGPSLHLNRYSSTTWLWCSTASSFIAAGRSRARMEALWMSFGSSVGRSSKNHGVMDTGKANKAIKYSPEKSAVKLKIGDEIKLTELGLVALFKAFFAEIEAKFV
jgi:hypothetical protein